MNVSAAVFDGTVRDPERILPILRNDVFPAAIRRMIDETLPFHFALYDTDRVPTNQRNLGDVRTRMGVLLEYELAKAVNAVLPDAVTKQVVLTYVIANRYPDLAFRTCSGGIGVRFEAKTIQTIAEEPAANFDTLIKDIRKGTDLVVVMLWEWQRRGQQTLRFPHIDGVFVMDAYQLAQMRDCYWLNRPPKDVGSGRQGYDLCFGVNCKKGAFNQEEGNYGKSLRIFDEPYEPLLPSEVRAGTTLKAYYDLCREVATLGIRRIGLDIASAFVGPDGPSPRVLSESLPVSIIAGEAERKLLIVGDHELPRATPQQVLQLMESEGASYAMLLNEKFKWRLRDRNGTLLAQGEKPATAITRVAARV